MLLVEKSIRSTIMSVRILTLAAAVLALGLATAPPVSAGGAKRAPVAEGGAHPSSGYYRGGPRVKGYAARRGGYSYRAEDVINTWGDSRTRYGGTNWFRFQGTDRQSSSGPFDHGFFFDSGIGPRGGESPYMN